MTAKGTTGLKQRNYPYLTVTQALLVGQVIQEKAAGQEVDRLTLAALLDRSPSSSGFTELLLASRAYGFTEGGKSAREFSLTDLGRRATSENPEESTAAKRQAVLAVGPFRVFLEAHDTKKVPAPQQLKAFLVNKAAVPESRAEECAEKLLANAREAGFVHNSKGSEYIRLVGASRVLPLSSEDSSIDSEGDDEGDDTVHEEFRLVRAAESTRSNGNGQRPDPVPVAGAAKKVFLAHGKNRKPLVQLKAMLTELGVPFDVAVDEAHAGRPVSQKVATMMREQCSSAIVIFSADEQFYRVGPDGEQVEVWRPSENAVYELGAASVLYGGKIIIFKEDRVSLPSDFSDLGHISFHGDEIQAHGLELLRELKAHGLVEIRVAV